MKKYILFLAMIAFFSSCSQSLKQFTTNEVSNQTAKVVSIYSDGLENEVIEDILILDFNRDIVNFADNIYSELNNIYVGGERFYNVQRREDLALVYNYDSASKKDGVGNKTFIINGDILLADFTTKKTLKKRTDYDNCLKYNKSTKQCALYPIVEDICTDYDYKLGVKVVIREISSSKIIYDKYFETKNTISKCNKLGSAKELPLLSSNLDFLSKELSKQLIDDLLPKRKIVNIPFLINEDIHYTKEESNMLKNGIASFRHDRKEAIVIFESLVESTRQYSSTALYNLALAYESTREFNKAKEFYGKAFEVASMQDEISSHTIAASQRINKSIKYKGLLK